MLAASPHLEPLPNRAGHALHDRSQSLSHAQPQDQEEAGLSRSASYTYLPNLQSARPDPGLKRTFSENVLSLPPEISIKPASPVHSANKQMFRRASRKVKKKLSASKVTASAEDVSLQIPFRGPKSRASDGFDIPKSPGRSVADTFRSFARKPWISTSRSPSPSKVTRRSDSNRVRSPTEPRPFADSANVIAAPLPTVSRRSPRTSRNVDEDQIPPAPEIARPVRSTTPQQRGKGTVRSLSEISTLSKSETSLRLSRASSLMSLRTKSSSEGLRMTSMKVPPMPSSISLDRLSAASVDVNRRKDPLWSAFRMLDGDYQKFQAKSSSLKANVIRTCLLPFLARNPEPLSSKFLRAEDLDRRVMILNKWWMGMLEMLNGRNNQSISGTDRPTFLEGVTGIMTRPEWRVPPFPSSSPMDTPRSSKPSLPRSKSTTSFDSNGSDALSDSIYQNVRNTFIQNLLSQMAFVIDKMSMRTAPASLVVFSGKACAYAFCFCPDVADILVKLWNLSPENVRRVYVELEITRATNLTMISKQVSTYFPSPLRSLSCDSQAAMIKYLKHRPPLHLGAAYINWFGPWVNRWNGRDSDLFFVFTKHFHMLVAEFLPQGAGMERRNRACVPGVVPVHAQMLAILETSIYRQAHQPQAESNVNNGVDGSSNPDATATLPMTTTNATRSMAENRLIMLLRDLLADGNPDHESSRELYADCFSDVLKSAARKLSLYNHDACFALCDFLEEVLSIMSRFHKRHNETTISDWPFWLQVFKVMMTSHNCLTEMRLIAFLYSTWNILISNENRRRELCLDWLLEPSFFERHFNHWSPMVRHYFLRLLCWRVARCDGDASDLDIQMLETLASRLNTCWAHYQYLRAEAEMLELAPPSSAPCSPAPARRLIIIRTDSQPVPANLFTSFEKLVTTASTNQPTPYRRHSSILNTIPAADSPSQQKKRWGLLKTLLGTPGNSRPGEVTPPASGDDSPILDEVTVDGLSIRKGSDAPKSRPSTPPHQPFSFKFSLEWLERPGWPSKNRRLSQPTLPANAQILLQIHQGVTGEVRPKKPSPAELPLAKYSGRALAEWALIVTECQIFFERRKEEGVPSNRLVETPTLGVESFRMFG